MAEASSKADSIFSGVTEAGANRPMSQASSKCSNRFLSVWSTPLSFDIWLSPDALPYVEGSKQRAMFHFSVTGFPQASSEEKRTVLRFKLRNTSNQAKLLSYGHKPFFTVLDAAAYRNSYLQQKEKVCAHNWQRVPRDVLYQKTDEGLELIFEYELAANVRHNDFVIFSYVQPFTLNDIRLCVDKFQEQM